MLLDMLDGLFTASCVALGVLLLGGCVLAGVNRS